MEIAVATSVEEFSPDDNEFELTRAHFHCEPAEAGPLALRCILNRSHARPYPDLSTLDAEPRS